jgi:hypothetical protein
MNHASSEDFATENIFSITKNSVFWDITMGSQLKVNSFDVGCLHGLPFNPEDGSNICPRNKC